MTQRYLLNAETILGAFHRLDAELVRRGLSDIAVIVVGGAALAIANYRDRSTKDIDTVTHLDQQVREAIAAVAADAPPGLELTEDWFNDDARPWRPIGMGPADCLPQFEGEALTVLIPDARWLFLMKVNRSLAVDLQDMRALWPHTGFSDAQAATAAFHDAYPGEALDPYMASHIQTQVIEHVGE